MKSKSFILVGIILLILVVVFLLFFLNKFTVSTSQSEIQKLSTETTEYSWGQPSQTSTNVFSYGNLAGEEITATTTTDVAFLPYFDNKEELEKQGYSQDINLTADSPGSSQWGYSKSINGKTQIVLFSYSVAPSQTSADQPLEFNCPCSATVSIFVSDPF